MWNDSLRNIEKNILKINPAPLQRRIYFCKADGPKPHRESFALPGFTTMRGLHSRREE